MQLAIPIFKDGKIYTSIDIQKPKTGIITRAYESMQKRNIFKAVLDFVSGCIEAIYSEYGEIISEPKRIKILCGYMPYITAETIALKTMSLINEDDSIEGVYPCPRCKTKIITDSNDDINPADKIGDLEIKCMNGNKSESIYIDLSEPVQIKNQKTGEILETIENFEMNYPTLNDCIMAGQNMREGQEIRVQMKMYINALKKVNGNEIDKKWAATWGMPLFNNMFPKDQAQIGKAMQEYGLEKSVERECPECGKIWKSPINTSNFFVSGLQPG